MLGFAEHPWCHPAALRAAGMTALRETCARARAPAFARLRLVAHPMVFARLRLAARNLRGRLSSASYLAGPSRSLIARARAPAFARLRLAAHPMVFARLRLAARNLRGRLRRPPPRRRSEERR